MNDRSKTPPKQGDMRYFGDCSPDNWLYRPLDGLPARAVLDANVMLDAALIADGLGVFVLRELARRAFSLHTSERALDEMRNSMSRARQTLSDISSLADLFTRSAGITIHSSKDAIPGISRHDNHLAAVAVDLGAFVATEDLPFLYDLNSSKVHARSLRELALELIMPDIPRQDLTIFGLGSGADGHLFVKFIADADIVSSDSRSWYLFDAPNFGSIRYDSSLRSLIFSPEVGSPVSVALELESDKQYSCLLNYSVGSDTSLTLKVKRFADQEERIASARIPPLQAPPHGSIVVLNSRSENEGWKGSIQSLTFGPYQLSSKVWRAAHSIVGVSPPVLTADLTLAAASLTEIKGDHVRRPRREHVLQLVNMSIPGFYPGRRVAEREAKWFDNG